MNTFNVIAVAVAATLAAVTLGQWSIGRLRPLGAIGDEAEYLTRSIAADPYAPTPFLRLPGMIWLVRRAGTEGRARLVMRCCSVLAVTIVAAATAATTNLFIALTAAAVLVAFPDRLILAPHLWPELPLGVLHAAAVWALLQAGPTGMVGLGAVGAAMALIRLDALSVVAVGATMAPSAGWAAAAVAPAVAVLLVLTVRNGRRYGIWLPDDTVRFNMTLARVRAGSDRPLQTDIAEVYEAWTNDRDATTGAHHRPARLAVDALDRLVRMLGADTFTAEVLLNPDYGPYRHCSAAARSAAARRARWAFPSLMTVAGLGIGPAVVSPGPARRVAIAAGVLWLAVSVVHARTRFRASLLPALSVLAGLGVRNVVCGDHLVAAAAGAAAGALTFAAPRRREHDM